MSNAAEKIDTQIAIVPSRTPMDLLDRAIVEGKTEIAEKLMLLQERWEANQARRAFNEAIAAAKTEIKPIARDKQGHNNKRYVSFDAIAKMVDPIISKHGLSYRFTTEQSDRINVTCVLSHRDGHFETTTLSGPADNSGNKNAIQSIGSTLTYLQRYSLVQMLGLAASDDDDDGKAGGAGETISEEQVIELRELIEVKSANLPAFLDFFKVPSLADLPAARLAEATTMLKAKKAKA